MIRQPEEWMYLGTLDAWRAILSNSIKDLLDQGDVEKQPLLDGLTELNETLGEEMVRAFLAPC